MHILVTGAQGCIGAWIVKLLLERNIDVLVFDLEPEPARLKLITRESVWKRLRIITGRIEDTARVKQLVRDERITHIIHLAALLIPTCQLNPVQGGLVNVVGTLNVFEAARDATRPVRLVYASSAAVWGSEQDYPDRPLSERDELKPATHYGVFKQANEENARIFYAANGISSVGLRPWSVYGVGRDLGLTADPTLAMRAVARREPFRIRVTGNMDLQYAADVAAAFIGCALSPLEGAHVFNLAGTIIHTDSLIKQLEILRPAAAGLITASGPQVPVAWRMDATALHANIPGLPQTPLEEGMRRTVELFERLHAEGRLA